MLVLHPSTFNCSGLEIPLCCDTFGTIIYYTFDFSECCVGDLNNRIKARAVAELNHIHSQCCASTIRSRIIVKRTETEQDEQDVGLFWIRNSPPDHRSALCFD